MASDTELSSIVETKTLPLTANVARILLLLRSLQRGRHNLDDPWIVLPLQLHEYDDLLILRDEQGTPNPAKGSGLRLMLRDFAPRGLLESVDPDASLLINSAKLCKFLGEVEDSERIRAQGPMFTPREMNLIMEERCERTPEPVYEEDGFVFGEEELSVHARFLDTPVDTGKVVEGYK
ncbi:hypothetical protein VE01_05777 [Pseudogymnoascus verrucosus]|uniref:Uncharacterized protein n=1 Tax=Pseudogymnoascus verrucosus TaxID=342668 RepID=A0A1B8GKQ7_9PEZI|nr:uncharacterized protein VE01_05777 [Pseudogymnoascus verrucosus]OBT96346.1 hypothetical protein VE01_05777 [Pseudogymnoascus verrucosus]